MSGNVKTDDLGWILAEDHKPKCHHLVLVAVREQSRPDEPTILIATWTGAKWYAIDQNRDLDAPAYAWMELPPPPVVPPIEALPAFGSLR